VFTSLTGKQNQNTYDLKANTLEKLNYYLSMSDDDDSCDLPRDEVQEIKRAMVSCFVLETTKT
jgi:hypothetical protein